MIFRLVGTKHMPELAQKLAQSLRPGDPVAIVREPDNPKDRRACRVEAMGEKVGYVPADDNRDLSRLMDQHKRASVRAEIVLRNSPGVYFEVLQSAIRNGDNH